MNVEIVSLITFQRKGTQTVNYTKEGKEMILQEYYKNISKRFVQFGQQGH